MEPTEIKIFTPATVANVCCGFDVMGFCLDTIGDEMIIRKTSRKGISIKRITGYDLPKSIEANVAGISASALYNHLNPNCGFEIEIDKHIKPGSGIGSSAASAAGSVFGINALLGYPLSKTELIKFAIKGEAFASKAEHADNLAPVIFGGFTLVKSMEPISILALPSPDDLYATIIHPQIEIKTSDARALIPDQVDLNNAITQWANVGSLVHALHTSNYDLLASSLNDVIIEPLRKNFIPKFNALKSIALKYGALGCGISGSGPSVFALSKGISTALKVEEKFAEQFNGTEIDYNTYVSPINLKGCKIIG